MWFTTSIVLAVMLVICFSWWSGRYYRLRSELMRTKRELEDRARNEERQNAERASHQTALFDSMVEGVLIVSPEGHVQMLNASLRKLLGVESNVVGKTLMEAFRLHELSDITERLSGEGRVTEFEIDSSSTKGKVLEINAVSLPDRSGSKQGALLMFHDLTKLKQLENGRREFVANVSHELRTPLSMIKGYLETLLDGALNDESVAEKFLKTIDRHADRLTFLIEDLLTISRLESGQVSMNLQKVALVEVVGKIEEDLRDRAKQRGVKISSDIDPSLSVEADPARLQQVLFNLADNAIKYGAQEGRVEIIASRNTSTGFTEVSVRDDGPGIPPDAIEHLFERFYRVDKARSRDQGGTGLGLAIVKHIVQAHGGEVWVTSDSGKGSQFHFTLKSTG